MMETARPSQDYIDFLGERLYDQPKVVEAMIELYRRMNQDGPK